MRACTDFVCNSSLCVDLLQKLKLERYCQSCEMPLHNPCVRVLVRALVCITISTERVDTRIHPKLTVACTTLFILSEEEEVHMLHVFLPLSLLFLPHFRGPFFFIIVLIRLKENMEVTIHFDSLFILLLKGQCCHGDKCSFE